VDFGFSEEQESIRALGRQILEQELDLERRKRVEASPAAVDEALWKQLAEASLLGIALPEAQGGMGMGFLELCCLLEEVGRSVAPVPAWETLVLGALPLARFGSAAQRDRWLPAVAAGDALLTAALHEEGEVRAARRGAGFSLEGAKAWVPLARRAARILVPARVEGGGLGLFLVDPAGEGVSLEGARTSTGAPLFAVRLAGAPVAADDRLGGDASPDGGEAFEWLRDRALVGVSALQMGVCARALEITAAYATEREQFGVPIGSFQAVQHRAADAFIDLEALRWCTWRAAWRLAEERPATRDAAVAKFWAADAGARIAGACIHLHGGMGADTDQPIHRYFLWSKTLELCLGAARPARARAGGARTGGPMSRPGSLSLAEVRVGDELPPLDVPLTAAVIVGGALASRDYTPVHHDRAAARAQGLDDVIMNILTTNGYVGRFVTDWAGPDAAVRGLAVKLGAPNLPGDTMRLRGKVLAVEPGAGTVTVEVVGKNSWGNHVEGKVTVALPSAR
jgi:3-oxocholest-4-en-26-oyl-CoA dehydrogenase beta subunit